MRDEGREKLFVCCQSLENFQGRNNSDYYSNIFLSKCSINDLHIGQKYNP